MTGILSLAVCLAVLLPLVYTLVKEEVSEQIKKAGDSWLENTPLLSYDRDAQVLFVQPWQWWEDTRFIGFGMIGHGRLFMVPYFPT